MVEFRNCPGSCFSYTSSTPIGLDSFPARRSSDLSSQPADGSYTLLARAKDRVGNVVDSGTVTVTVDNSDPSDSLSISPGSRPDLQYWNAGTGNYYYNPAASGDFTVSASPADTGGS